VIEALSAHLWPTMQYKPRPTASVLPATSYNHDSQAGITTQHVDESTRSHDLAMGGVDEVFQLTPLDCLASHKEKKEKIEESTEHKSNSLHTTQPLTQRIDHLATALSCFGEQDEVDEPEMKREKAGVAEKLLESEGKMEREKGLDLFELVHEMNELRAYAATLPDDERRAVAARMALAFAALLEDD
jgi:hypothetical protein